MLHSYIHDQCFSSMGLGFLNPTLRLNSWDMTSFCKQEIERIDNKMNYKHKHTGSMHREGRHFGYAVSIRTSVHMFGLLYVHLRRTTFSLSLYLCSHQGKTPPSTNFVIYPLCFLTAYKMMSRPSCLAYYCFTSNAICAL